MSDGVGDDPGIGGKMWTNGQWDFENPATSVIDNLKGTQPRANKTWFKRCGLEKLTSRLMFHDIYCMYKQFRWTKPLVTFNSLPLMPSGQLNLPNGSSILSYVACDIQFATSFRLRQIPLVMCHRTLPSPR
jgi:hypothetical protein